MLDEKNMSGVFLYLGSDYHEKIFTVIGGDIYNF